MTHIVACCEVVRTQQLPGSRCGMSCRGDLRARTLKCSSLTRNDLNTILHLIAVYTSWRLGNKAGRSSCTLNMLVHYHCMTVLQYYCVTLIYERMCPSACHGFEPVAIHLFVHGCGSRLHSAYVYTIPCISCLEQTLHSRYHLDCHDILGLYLCLE